MKTSQSVTLEVVADSITTTRISGKVANVNQEPLEGVVVEVGDLQTTTDANGYFTLETDTILTADTLVVRGDLLSGAATYPYIAEKLPLVLGKKYIQDIIMSYRDQFTSRKLTQKTPLPSTLRKIQPLLQLQFLGLR